MSGTCCCPVAFLGENVAELNAVAARLVGQSRRFPFTRQSSSASGNRGHHHERTAVQVHALSLKKLPGKVSVPIWVLDPSDDFSAVRHLLLSKRCNACYVWLNCRQTDDEMIASATRLVMEFRRCLPSPAGGSGGGGVDSLRVRVYLAAERNSSEFAPTQASPDWKRICQEVRTQLKTQDAEGYRNHMQIHLDVIRIDSNSVEPLARTIRAAAEQDLKQLETRNMLERVQTLGGKLEAIRKACSLFMVPWEEYVAVAMEKTHLSAEQVKQASKANGQVVVVERPGWLPHVVIGTQAMSDTLSRLLTDAGLRARHTGRGMLTAADVQRVFGGTGFSADQLAMLLSVLQDLLLTYRTGVVATGGGGQSVDADWCLPLLNDNLRPSDKFLLSPVALRGSIRLKIPCAELFPRIQVEASRQFGANSVEQWKHSCIVSASPGILLCTTPDHRDVAWTVAGADEVATAIYGRVKTLVVEQCFRHVPANLCRLDERLSDDFFRHVVRRSDDGRRGDDIVRVEQGLVDAVQARRCNQFNEEIGDGVTAGGSVQKHPAEGGVSAAWPYTADSDVICRGVLPMATGGGGGAAAAAAAAAAAGAAAAAAAPAAPTIVVQSSRQAQASSPVMAPIPVSAPQYSPAIPTAHAASAPSPQPPPSLPLPVTSSSSGVGVRSPAGTGSAASSDESTTDTSTDSSSSASSSASGSARCDSVGSLSSTSSSGSDQDAEELTELPAEDSVEYFSGGQSIQDMKLCYKIELAEKLDVLDEHSDRGWAAFLAAADFEPDVEQKIRRRTSGWTMAILDHAVALGLSMSFLGYIMSAIENSTAAKVVEAATTAIIARQTEVAIPELPAQTPMHMPPAVAQHGPLPPYAGAVGCIMGPPPVYPGPRVDAKPTYSRSVPEGGKVILISYHYESEEFAAEVARWCETLRARGIDVRLDQFEKEIIQQKAGGLLAWKEELYRDARMVLVFGSRKYLTHAMDPQDDQPLAQSLANYPCGCDVRTEYSRLLIPAFSEHRISPVPVILRNFVRGKRRECFPPLLQSPGSYTLPSDEESLICRLTGQNLVSRPPVFSRPDFQPRVNPFTEHVLREGYNRVRAPPLGQSPFGSARPAPARRPPGNQAPPGPQRRFRPP